MDQSNFAKDLAESEEAFHDQFNPNSGNHHGGDRVPVPVGGQRIPESMPTVYPENVGDLGAYVAQTENVDYGPEYESLMREREFFNNTLKKAFSKLTIQVETCFRHRESNKKSGKSDGEQDKQKLAEGVAELKVLEQSLTSNPKYKERYAEFPKVIAQAEAEIATKEQLAEFNFAAKRITALAFKDSQLLLEQVKKIKKEYEAKNKPKQVEGEEQKAQ